MAASATATTVPAVPATSGGAAYRVLLAWAVVLMLAGIANRSRVGHVTLYYLLALSLFFLIVTQFRWFASVLRPITG